MLMAELDDDDDDEEEEEEEGGGGGGWLCCMYELRVDKLMEALRN
jgi:hypothetical protein